MLIYHIVLPEHWSGNEGDHQYEPASLRTEGFIHCSFADQLDAVLLRYYKDAEDVIILEIDSEKLLSRLVEEPSTNNEIYPHIYGPINRDAIVGIVEKQVKSLS
jgi:uncharacterized protein (DUF952 family)